ncbi:MAG: hypothetical protein WD491_06910 [Balneolales bacterium]
MNDRKKELEQELEAIQNEIEDSLSEIRNDIHSWTDPRYWIHRYPLHTVGTSLVVGLLLSQAIGRSKKSSEGPGLSSLFFTEIKKFASRSAANYVVKIIEENVERTRRAKNT